MSDNKKKTSQDITALITPSDIAKANKERRQNNRQMVKFKVPVVIKIESLKNEQRADIHGFIADIGRHGIGIFSGEKILTSTAVTAEIKGRDYEWKLIGKTVWCNELPLSGVILKEYPIHYRIGIDVDSEDPEMQKIMENLIAYLSPTE